MMSIPSKRTVTRRLKELRTLIDTDKDPTVTRIAYAMEGAIRWATCDTVGWEPPAKEAIILAKFLREDLARKTHGKT